MLSSQKRLIYYVVTCYPQKTPAVGGVCSVRAFCGQGGSSDADVRTFWCKSHRIFWNL